MIRQWYLFGTALILLYGYVIFIGCSRDKQANTEILGTIVQSTEVIIDNESSQCEEKISAHKKPETKFDMIFKAAYDGDDDTLKYLLDCGCSVNITDELKRTPLHYAARGKRSKTIKLLLEKGANPDAADIDGQTPLHNAVRIVARHGPIKKGLLKTIDYLSDKSNNINFQNKAGWTPLHIAAFFWNVDAVDILLQRGANRTILDEKGRSPMDFAKSDSIYFNNTLNLNGDFRFGTARNTINRLLE